MDSSCSLETLGGRQDAAVHEADEMYDRKGKIFTNTEVTKSIEI